MNNPMGILREHERLLAFDSLAESALHAWGLRPVSMQRIACRENAVYEVKVEDGQRMALRIHRYGYHDRASMQSELAWMQALTSVGIATPTVVLTLAGEAMAEVTSDLVPLPHLCDMLDWVDGKPLGFAEDPDLAGERSLLETYRTVGSIAAQIHNHSAAWQEPAGFVRPHWNLEGCLGQAALWGPWFNLEVLDADERRTLSAAAAVVTEMLQRYGQDREVYGLVHADFVPDNLIEREGRVVVLDFDDSGYGWYLWELATAVFWYLGTPHYGPALEGYVAGYRAERALSDDELCLLPQFLLMRALVYMGWMQSRHTQPTARRLTGRVRELCLALAERVLAGNVEYQSIALELAPLPR